MDTADNQPLPSQKTLQVGTAQRTIHARAVTITCQHCGTTVTRLQYPGYPPRYCSPKCKRAVHRVRDQQRKATQRAGPPNTPQISLSDTLAQVSDRLSTPLSPAPAPSKPPKFIRLRGDTLEAVEAEIHRLRIQYGDQMFFSAPAASLPHQWRSFGARLPAASSVDAAGRENPGSSAPRPTPPAAALLDDDEEW